MRTKTITIHPEIKDDLKYMKYCKAEELSYELRDIPLDVDVEKEYNTLRQNVISSSVDGEIVSISSKMVNNPSNFSPIEEITISYN